MKPSDLFKSGVSGGIGLGMAALVIASALPLHAQETEFERKKAGGEHREGPVARPEPAQRPGPAPRFAPAPVQRPVPGPVPAQRPVPGPASAQRSAPAPRPGFAPAQRPGVAPVLRPGPGNPRPVAPVRAGGAVPFRGGPAPGVAVIRTRDGGEIHRAPGGAIREVRTPGGAVIHYAPDGRRNVEVMRPDGRVVFANANGRGGFVQRPFMVHNQPFVQRTYVERGVVYTRVYRPYVYRGITFNVYMPSHYYRPGFYAWAYHPWGRPVYYPWGWAGQSWFGYYRGYCRPYPYYSSPFFWLTDFLIGTTLEVAYQERLDSGVASAPPAGPYQDQGLSPEVKQDIADEVRLQVDQERAEQQAMGQGGYAPAAATPPLFSGNVSRIFLVSNSVVAYAGSRECDLSEGDVLQLNGPPAPNATYADVVVLASRTGTVPKGSVVSVSLLDLQDMQNHMRATIDQGLGDLQSHQGQNGLPALPPQDLGSSDAPFASQVQPDGNATGELSQAAQEANSAGQQVLSQGPQPQAAPATQGGAITLGMTVSEVRSALGSPKQSATIGAKEIDVYQDFKVTFMNGRVTDIQ